MQLDIFIYKIINKKRITYRFFIFHFKKLSKIHLTRSTIKCKFSVRNFARRRL